MPHPPAKIAESLLHPLPADGTLKVAEFYYQLFGKRLLERVDSLCQIGNLVLKRHSSGCSLAGKGYSEGVALLPHGTDARSAAFHRLDKGHALGVKQLHRKPNLVGLPANALHGVCDSLELILGSQAVEGGGAEIQLLQRAPRFAHALRRLADAAGHALPAHRQRAELNP